MVSLMEEASRNLPRVTVKPFASRSKSSR